MDIRKPIWHGQLAVTGIATPTNHSGSIIAIIGECLKDLQQTQPRALAEGHREIVIRIRDKPYPASKLESDLERSIEITSQLDLSDESHGPSDGESADMFRARLISEGTPPNIADLVTASWFPNQGSV